MALRAMLVLTVILGVAYPLAMTGLAQVVFPDQANGSTVQDTDGQVVGSRLLGQAFTDTAGQPLPQYFQPRPSAAGEGYDAGASSGSNLGPDSQKLVAEIRARQEQIAAFNGVPLADVPADAVTASGSGLDPDISPEYAAIQISRVAKTRSLSVDQVTALVTSHTVAPDLGYIGPHRVNVVTLNLALDQW
jgi:K+-transporting ATPase ATPase C chain